MDWEFYVTFRSILIAWKSLSARSLPFDSRRKASVILTCGHFFLAVFSHVKRDGLSGRGTTRSPVTSWNYSKIVSIVTVFTCFMFILY